GRHHHRCRPARSRHRPGPRCQGNDARCASRRPDAVNGTIGYLALGTNLGNRRRNLSAARRRLRQKGVRIVRQSSVIETEPWGDTDQPRFLNQVVEVEWAGTPRKLLTTAKAVEKEGGRKPT